MRMAALGLLALLAACEERRPLPPERPDAQVVAPAAVKPPAQLEFTGRWAVRPDMCETGWWDFGGSEIVTAGELACSIARDQRTATSAKLELTCVGEGMPIVETWQVNAVDGGRLSVKRDAAAPVVLMKCPAT